MVRRDWGVGQTSWMLAIPCIEKRKHNALQRTLPSGCPPDAAGEIASTREMSRLVPTTCHPIVTSAFSAPKIPAGSFPAWMRIKCAECPSSEGVETPSGRICFRTSETACYAASNFFPEQAIFAKQGDAPITLGGHSQTMTSFRRAILNYEDHTNSQDAFPIRWPAGLRGTRPYRRALCRRNGAGRLQRLGLSSEPRFHSAYLHQASLMKRIRFPRHLLEKSNDTIRASGNVPAIL